MTPKVVLKWEAEMAEFLPGVRDQAKWIQCSRTLSVPAGSAEFRGRWNA